ncbi:MAG: helix-turn-helix transcriptional regulator [Atopobiaceae bacterium]|nr:helix-turn-helix transcriptional regulator [Atopobiaceae bacterium]
MQNTVKEHREAIGFSQERLGNVLGVSRNTVANWERGEQIKSTRLMQMVALFGCDVNELLGLTSDVNAMA